MPQLTILGKGKGPPPGNPDTVSIECDVVRAVSPEGDERTMKLADLLERVAPPRISTCDTVLPDGVKCVIPIPKGAVFVHQTPPRVHRFEWIANDSPAPYGSEATYREVSIALPYLIVLAVFDASRGSYLQLGGNSECFFSNRPIDAQGVDTELHFPALLNCSRFPIDASEKPLSWICVQHLSASSCRGAKSESASIRMGIKALLHHLLESRFNLSSENHELSSWFSETVKAAVDPRVASIEAWEQATIEDPLFALEVPWLSTGSSLKQVVERIAEFRGTDRSRVTTARDLMRVLFQESKRTGGKQ